jgi:hypothetical protein
MSNLVTSSGTTLEATDSLVPLDIYRSGFMGSLSVTI